MDNEVSYDQVVEDGYRLAIDQYDPADILLNLSATKALVYELNSLPEQQRCICRMVSAGMTEYE